MAALDLPSRPWAPSGLRKAPANVLLELDPDHPLYSSLIFASPMLPGAGSVPSMLYGPALVQPGQRALPLTAPNPVFAATSVGVGVAFDDSNSNGILHSALSPFYGQREVSCYAQWISNGNQTTSDDIVRSDGCLTPFQWNGNCYHLAVWANGNFAASNNGVPEFGAGVPVDAVSIWSGVSGTASFSIAPT